MNAEAVEISPEQARELAQRARRGDEKAFKDLIGPLRLPLFRYLYRTAANWEDAEELLQNVLLRILRGLGAYKGEMPFRAWAFGIACGAAADYLERKPRWTVDAHLAGEREIQASPDRMAALEILAGRPDFRYEVDEHIAFCLTSVSRSLSPEEQAAIVLRDVMSLSQEEAAAASGLEPALLEAHRAGAHRTLAGEYETLCTLVSPDGRCDQCQRLRLFMPERSRGADLPAIPPPEGQPATPENLLRSRLKIVRDANLEHGRTRALHRAFFSAISAHEDRSPA